MLQQHKHHAEMGTQLNELRKGMEILGDERKDAKIDNIVGSHRWFLVLTFFILLGFLSRGSLLYGQDALFIGENGNVGIGTSDPKAKLDIAGTVKANGINLLIPIGTIMAYGGDTNDDKIKKQLEEIGWLPCNGDEKSIHEYSELFAVIKAYFGSSKDHFKLPDLRGRFLRGVDQGLTRDPDANSRIAPAQYGNNGDKVGSVQDDEVRTHTHSYSASRAENRNPTKGDIMGGTQFINDQGWNTGAYGGKETRPKNIYVNWIIKAK